jgi:uncharacterized protein YndB with AHSA1/START domain
MSEMTAVTPAATAVLKMEFPIRSSAERVWQAITQETGRWWDQDFAAVGGSGGARLEPRLGGRLYEEAPDGKGLTWSTVIAIDPGKSIDFLGCMTPEWSGPTMTMVKLAVEATEEGALLRMTEGLLGNITEDSVKSMEEGWSFLFGTKLKGYLEA